MISSDSSDDDIADLISSFPGNAAVSDLDRISELTIALARSGSCLEGWECETADVPSTGGPGSLSTILCPVLLVNAGFAVPKLGIPGRPAGGIDALAQIAGYKTKLTEVEIREVIKNVQYAHFVSAGRIAPLDSRVFQVRQKLGRQNIPGLVVASILSKKLAVGVKNVCVDIRALVGGNFGESVSEATSNSWMFTEVGKRLKIRVETYVSDGGTICQPNIGRSEALLALHEISENTANSWLMEHFAACMAMSGKLSPGVLNYDADEFRRVVHQNIVSQGGSIECLHAIATRTKEAHCNHILAPQDGFLVVDLAIIRSILVSENNLNEGCGITEFGDKAGVIFKVKPGCRVTTGQELASFRIASRDRLSLMNSALTGAIRVLSST